MPDAVAHKSKRRTKKAPADRSAGVSAQEAHEAIRKAFPFEGDLRVRRLWSIDGLSRFRANWFHDETGASMIVKSLFLWATRTENGLAVKDKTVVR